MLEILTKNYEYLDVNDYELKDEVVYTCETLAYFKEIYPNDKIYFICGADNLSYIDKWKNGENILKNYKILVMKRKGEDIEKLLKRFVLYKDNIIVADIEQQDISSTDIRDRLKENKEVLDVLDKDVYEYIRKNKSGSEYASAFYDLEKKYGSANLYKGLNNYKTTGKALVDEIAPVKETIEDLTDTIKETNKAVKNLAKEIKDVKKIAQEGKPLTLEDLEDFYKQTDASFRMVEEDRSVGFPFVVLGNKYFLSGLTFSDNSYSQYCESPDKIHLTIVSPSR
jgi:nicotinate (nicotinamide) nucleotide adenylyltransferase